MKHAIAWTVLLTLVVHATLWAQAGPDADYPQWLKGKLTELADAKIPADKRGGIRDEIIKSIAGVPEEQRIVRARELASQIPSLMNSKDATTSIYACQTAASVKHVYLVPTLTDGLKSDQSSVRYWSARGLADVQVGMMDFVAQVPNAKFFDEPIEALGARGVQETDSMVLVEIYRALSDQVLVNINRKLLDAAKMNDPKYARRKPAIYKEFGSVFKAQTAKLADRPLDLAAPMLAGVDAAALWATTFRQDPRIRLEIVRGVGQTLAWTSQIYVFEGERLNNSQKADMEDVMMRSSRAMAVTLTDQDVQKMPWVKADTEYPRDPTDPPLKAAWEVKAYGVHGWARARIRDGDPVGLAQHVLDWLGGPGVANYKLKALGTPPAEGLKPKDTPAVRPPTTTEPE